MLALLPASHSIAFNPRTQKSGIFIENKGQIVNQDRVTRTDIDFKLQAAGISAFIGSGQLHYQWVRQAASNNSKTQQDVFISDKKPWNVATPVNIYRMDVALEGANTHATPVADEQADYYENYYLPQCPEGTQAKSFSKIIYRNIYPNIDWVLFTNNSSANGQAAVLEYDFIVHPGGNPADIKLVYNGATSLTSNDGNVIIVNPFGNITEQRPYSYNAETKQEIPSAFVLKDNTISFDVKAPLDGTLIIDPHVYNGYPGFQNFVSLNWATYDGSTGGTTGNSVVADASGNSYLSGYTHTTNNIATTGAYQVNFAGISDAFLSKFNRGGICQWSTYYGAKDSDYVTAAAVDVFGNVYLTGGTFDTASSHFFGTPGCHQAANGGNGIGGQTRLDGFLTKFSSAGTRLWSTYYGGMLNDYVRAIATDGYGYVYIGGYTESTTGIATPGSFQPVFSGTVLGADHDGFLAKFNPAGTRQWGTYYKATVNAITCDSAANVFIGGGTSGSSILLTTLGAYQTIHAGGVDGFIGKFDSSGARKWATYYGDTRDDEITALACDSFNNLYIGGTTNSVTGLASAGAYQTGLYPTPTNGGCVPGYVTDGFVAKFTENGSRVWGTYYGDSITETISDIRVRPDGKAFYIAGICNQRRPFNCALASDAYFAKFSVDGNYKWHVNGDGIYTKIDFGNGRIFMGGTANTALAMPTTNGWQPTFSASQIDPNRYGVGYLSEFQADTSVYLNATFRDTLQCQGETRTIPVHTINKFNPSNVFTLQLSDASGSFASPLTIGTLTSDTAGNIQYTIPAGTTPGTGYRYRLIASSPKDTSGLNGSPIRISPRPAKPTITSNSPICSGDTLKVSAQSALSGVRYIWVINGVPIPKLGADTITKKATVSTAVKYKVAVDLFGCVSDADSTTPVVNQAATPSITLSSTPGGVAGEGMTINYSSSNTNGGTSPRFRWTKNGVNITGANTNTYSAVAGTDVKSTDTICVVMISSASCVDPDTVKSCLNILVEPAGINNVADRSVWTLYPNPNSGLFTLTGNTMNDNVVHIEIVNALGQSVFVSDALPVNKQVNRQIKLEHLASGMYTLKIVAGELNLQRNFVISR